ncbi:MAG: hypothetical protein PHT84_06640 [Candidatus Pacebacteria bacterium]|nr:hypothetical protein [Candidatus Paceibacterota bacterium]
MPENHSPVRHCERSAAIQTKTWIASSKTPRNDERKTTVSYFLNASRLRHCERGAAIHAFAFLWNASPKTPTQSLASRNDERKTTVSYFLNASRLRHCERSAAIHAFVVRLWIASSKTPRNDGKIIQKNALSAFHDAHRTNHPFLRNHFEPIDTTCGRSMQ